MSRSRRFLPLPLLFTVTVLCACDLLGLGDEKPPRDAPLKTMSLADLRSTEVVPHTGMSLDTLRNQVWCGTVQLAWNMVTDSLIGAPPALAGDAQTTSMVDGLNLRRFGSSDLDTASYVALAGFGHQGITDRIQQALAERFENPPAFDLPVGESEFLAYAYLKKRLLFAEVFQSLDDPIVFNGDKRHRVLAFGIDPDADYQTKALLLRQLILKGWSSKGVIIELVTTSTHDHLLLAMVEPGATLNETWNRVLAEDALRGDETLDHYGEVVLRIPKINFDLKVEFEPLQGENHHFLNPGWEEWFILKAFQNIRFNLSESGADLESASGIWIDERSAPMFVVFDRPFLLAMIEEGADYPDFLLWIADTELLATW